VARERLEQAVALHSDLGNHVVAERLRTLLNSQSKRRSSSHLPGGLSEREVEVLRLVANGKSNREIAAALVLSEKTVENHLANIYGRLRVDNRAGATAFAVRHGLA